MDDSIDKSYESRLKQAYFLVKNTGIPIYKAALLNEIPYSTLRRKVKKGEWWPGYNGRESYMSSVHEKSLSDWIRLSAKRGLSPSVSEVLFRAQHIFRTFYPELTAFKDYLPGRKWLTLFLGRHPELKLTKPKYCDKAFSRVTQESLEHWFRFVYCLVMKEK
jgi:hypothetical protein